MRNRLTLNQVIALIGALALYAPASPSAFAQAGADPAQVPFHTSYSTVAQPSDDVKMTPGRSRASGQ